MSKNLNIQQKAWFLLRWTGVIFAGLILPVALFILWKEANQRGWAPEQILPAPSLVWQSIKDLWDTGDLTLHIKASLVRFGWSFAIGGSLGLIYGLATGLSKTLDDIFSLVFQVIHQVPNLGWLPILIVLVGLNEKTCAILIGQAVFVALALNTQQGVKQIPHIYKEVSLVYQLSAFTKLWRVILPGALPQIFTGLRAALANGWVALVVVELLAAGEGLGYLMSWGRQLFQLDLVLVGILAVGIIGLLLNIGIGQIERFFFRWKPASGKAN